MALGTCQTINESTEPQQHTDQILFRMKTRPALYLFHETRSILDLYHKTRPVLDRLKNTGGWMDGCVGVKEILRIAYSNKNYSKRFPNYCLTLKLILTSSLGKNN